MLKPALAACAALIMFVLFCPPCWAQDLPESADPPADQNVAPKPDKPPVTEKVRRYVEDNPVIRKLSDDGFYPRLGGLNAGSGLAGGGGYRRHFTQIFTDVSGAISTKVYLGVDAKVRWLQTAGKTFEVWTDYQFRDDTKDPFYGIGLQSPPAASTDYAIRTNDAVARAVVHVRSWLSAGAGIGYFAPAVRRGRDSRIRSIEQVFTDTNAPGLAQQPKYIHDNVFAEIDLRDTTGSPRRGGLYRTTYELWNDGTFDQYDFRRLEVDASHFFAVTESDVVALHLGLAYTNNAPGSRVPFYLLPFLGGGDTLRAYREFRFRDENAGVFNAEVRHHLNTLVHIAGFVDAGKVAHDWQDINPTDLKMSYGFGVRAATASRMFLRCDTAFGGHEGPRVFVKFTPAF